MHIRELVLAVVLGFALGAFSVALADRTSVDRLSKETFAQQGEDILLASTVRYLGIEAPTYLDIGAFDPIHDNNTYLLYRMGGRGVLVEPNPALTGRLRNARPRDTVLAVGVGIEAAGEADYYLIEGSPQLNGFDRDETYRMAATLGGEHLVSAIKLPLVEIDTIIEENFDSPPDVISIDVEGLDLAILQSLDFERHRPGIVCAETLVRGTMSVNEELVAFLLGQGYTVRGSTWVNTIFVDSARVAARP